MAFIGKNGGRYATEELRDAADRHHEAAQAARQAAETQRAAEWEAGIREKFMGTPGASDADWQRNRQSLLDEARKRAALSEDDEARQAFAGTYR